jgi:short subunit dehydrogenase-like uncharacterized protein
MKNRLLLYGATGFTGRLIAKEAKIRWQREERETAKATPESESPKRAWLRRPVLAGRNPASLKAFAEDLGLPWVAVELEDHDGLDRALGDVAVVLNAAGPYQVTAEPLVKACLRTRTHYLDVCGAFEVFRRLDNFNTDAVDLRVLIMPGVGFSVVASDILVAALQKRMGQELHYLRVAMSRVDFVSRGSMKSLQEGMREGVSVRRAGKLTTVPVGRLERTFTFREGGSSSICTAVRLPDLITAPITTSNGSGSDGVPNVETYAEVSALDRIAYQLGSALALPLQTWPLKQLVDAQLAAWPEGPTDADRDSANQVVLVEGEDRYRSSRITFRLETPDVYEFTAWSAVSIAELVLKNESKDKLRGFKTPAGIYAGTLQPLVEQYVRKSIETVF